MVPVWVFAFTLALGVLGWVFFLFGCPLPFPDNGFRIVSAPGEKIGEDFLSFLDEPPTSKLVGIRDC